MTLSFRALTALAGIEGNGGYSSAAARSECAVGFKGGGFGLSAAVSRNCQSSVSGCGQGFPVVSLRSAKLWPMWPWYALVAMICFALMQLAFRYLSERGVDSAAMLFLVFAFAAIPYFVHVRATRTPLPSGAGRVALLAGTALLSYVGNFYSVRAVAEAPNPGYAVAIVGLQAAVVTLAAAVMFLDADLSWARAVGVGLCIAGVALLVT